MRLSPEKLAARYDRPYRKRDRIEVAPERFRKAIERGDDGAWGVGALVVEEGRALFVREGETWLLPGGRLEPGESPEAGARRELREETGLSITIDDLCAIAEQTFLRRGSEDSYEFYFATFLGSLRSSASPADARPNADPIDAVEWRAEVPPNAFDRELLTRLFETYV